MENDKYKNRKDRLDKILDKSESDIEKDELLRKKEREEWLKEKVEFICTSKWCKVSYVDHRYSWYEKDIKTCHKCRSFDGELSGGVSFESKDYSGERHDGMAHQVDFKFSDYNKGKWGKFWNK